MNNFGSNGQRHAVLGLMECLHPALHDGPCFERIDRDRREINMNMD